MRFINPNSAQDTVTIGNVVAVCAGTVAAGAADEDSVSLGGFDE